MLPGSGGARIIARHRRGIDTSGAGVLRRARAGRATSRWCAVPASPSPHPTRRRRVRRSHVLKF